MKTQGSYSSIHRFRDRFLDLLQGLQDPNRQRTELAGQLKAEAEASVQCASAVWDRYRSLL